MQCGEDNDMTSVEILGIRVDNVSYDEAMARVEGMLRDGGMHQIATVNPEFVIISQKNEEFARVLNGCALNVPDGVGLLWASRRIGKPLTERVTGQELVDRISALAARCGERIFFLGARRGSRTRSRACSWQDILGCRLPAAMQAHPPRMKSRASSTESAKRGRGILFVAFGPPKQEFWIARNADKLGVSIAMGVGGNL